MTGTAITIPAIRVTRSRAESADAPMVSSGTSTAPDPERIRQAEFYRSFSSSWSSASAESTISA